MIIYHAWKILLCNIRANLPTPTTFPLQNICQHPTHLGWYGYCSNGMVNAFWYNYCIMQDSFQRCETINDMQESCQGIRYSYCKRAETGIELAGEGGRGKQMVVGQ